MSDKLPPSQGSRRIVDTANVASQPSLRAGPSLLGVAMLVTFVVKVYLALGR